MLQRRGFDCRINSLGSASDKNSQAGRTLDIGDFLDDLVFHPRICNRQYPNGKIDIVAYIGNVYAIDSHAGFGGDVFDKDGLARALMARDYKDPILVLDV